MNEKCIGAEIEIQEILAGGGKNNNHAVRVIECWKMLPRDVVKSPSLRMVKT